MFRNGCSSFGRSQRRNSCRACLRRLAIVNTPPSSAAMIDIAGRPGGAANWRAGQSPALKGIVSG
jgi:hypothetical protein